MEDPRCSEAMAAIDAANADDPVTIAVGDLRGPKEVVHGQLTVAWVRRLDPSASDAQLVAARGSHLRRWELPRSDYPEGRRGYLQWRKEQKRRHADGVGAILTSVGYDAAFVDEVQRIIRKEGLGREPAVQTHEDALCLVFLETQLADVAGQLGDDKTVDVLRKTLPKMSAGARAEALALPLTDRARAVLEEAVSADS